ncbi:histidinol-phosphate transaminase [Corynebacterium bovis]|uniref:histidinol-phosphate transaminase n=1 Tax=Corynebacterium bovis TaxID=36808 RepID=UPI002447F6E4|nr:histidinol-phosphate transaminase [Corynebacterium bovis]MDH2456599.1 histidinol-phosphate transaminase [Corynebacterium bovis]
MIRADLSLLSNYVQGRDIADLVKLSSNESPHGPLPTVRQAVIHALDKANRYPDMAAMELRSTIATWASDLHPNLPAVTPENVTVGNGSSAICLQIVHATCHDGDEVIFPWRSFEAYPGLCRIAGATPVAVPLTPDLRNDLPAMAAAVTDRTRLIIVCNPNNPTGTTVTDAEFREFMGSIPETIPVVLDEAYIDYTDSDTPDGLSLLSEFPNLAVMRTFSKAYGLAGLRIGFLVGHRAFVEGVSKVGVPFAVSSLALAAGVTSLAAQDELRERVETTCRQRERVVAAVREDLRVPSETNFVWLPLGERSEEIAELMIENGVVVRCFAGEGVRLTVTDEEETEALIAALEGAGLTA